MGSTSARGLRGFEQLENRDGGTPLLSVMKSLPPLPRTKSTRASVVTPPTQAAFEAAFDSLGSAPADWAIDDSFAV